jgi:hypothetical protein
VLRSTHDVGETPCVRERRCDGALVQDPSLLLLVGDLQVQRPTGVCARCFRVSPGMRHFDIRASDECPLVPLAIANRSEGDRQRSRRPPLNHKSIAVRRDRVGGRRIMLAFGAGRVRSLPLVVVLLGIAESRAAGVGLS